MADGHAVHNAGWDAAETLSEHLRWAKLEAPSLGGFRAFLVAATYCQGEHPGTILVAIRLRR